MIRLRMTIRERNYLHSNCLLRFVQESAWYKLYRDGGDSDLINVVSLNRNGFERLLSEFRKHFSWKSGTEKGGRPPRCPDKHCALALVLHSYCSEAGQKTWCEFFGIVPSTLSRLYDKAEEALSLSLRNLPESKFEWPELEEQRRLATLVSMKEPLIVGKWGFVDGKNYTVLAPTERELQNAHYNGWLHSPLIDNCALLSAAGLCVWEKLNFYGSWNDGEMSRSLREKLSNPTKNVDGHGIISDTAFPIPPELVGRIITPLKDGDIRRASRETRSALRYLSAAITSLRQAAEWGMNCVPQVYRILQKKLPFNQEKRGRLLENCYRLWNLRVRTTGISQVKNHFDA